MKVYYFGEPNGNLPVMIRDFALKHQIFLIPIILLIILIWVFVLIPAWAAVKVGNAGHFIAYRLGFRSHDW